MRALNLRQHTGCVDINRVAAWRFDDWHASIRDVPSEIRRRRELAGGSHSVGGGSNRHQVNFDEKLGLGQASDANQGARWAAVTILRQSQFQYRPITEC